MIDSLLFANALLIRAQEKDISISNLKLQKLVYYCQGFTLALTGQRLFDEKIEAWEHGPVAPAIYYEFKHFGNDLITVDANQDVVDQLEQTFVNIIDFVLEKFGRFKAWHLRNKTHQESPWRAHYDTTTQTLDGLEITEEQLLSFFNQEIDKVQDETFAKILDSLNCKYVELPSEITDKNAFFNWLQGT